MTQAASEKAGLIVEGQKAPAFTLKDQLGKTHKLADYSGQCVVLYFYPKDSTPGCTKQACGFRDAYPAWQKLGVQVLGVSPDNEKSHGRFVEKYGLPFPLLIDPDNKLATKYGVWQQKSMFGKKYMGIVRTTYLIGPDGKVARRWDKVKVGGHIEEVAAALKEIG